MKNLEYFGVQELSANEAREIEGGIVPLLIVAFLLLSTEKLW
ncbi:hypothetical protein [Tenacibaculum dicentrarchi]